MSHQDNAQSPSSSEMTWENSCVAGMVNDLESDAQAERGRAAERSFKMKNLKNELKKSFNEIRSLKNSLEDESELCVKRSEEVRVARNQCTTLEHKVATLESEIANYQTELSTARQDESSLKGRIAVFEQVLNKERASLKTIRVANEETMTKLKTQQEKVAQLEDIVKTKSAAVDDTKTQLAQALTRASKKEMEVKDLNAKLLRIQEHHEATKIQLSTERQNAEHHAAAGRHLSSQMETLRVEKSGLVKKVESLEEQVKHRDAAGKKTADELRDVSERIEELDAVNQTQAKQIEGMKRAHSDQVLLMQQQLDESDKKTIDFVQQISAQETEIKELQATVSVLKKKRKKTEQARASLFGAVKAYLSGRDTDEDSTMDMSISDDGDVPSRTIDVSGDEEDDASEPQRKKVRVLPSTLMNGSKRVSAKAMVRE
eukprot:GFYU01000458.1.p1 GENE.GFYU01000458.1~~GFYU01000458.1.p1  ORF type:complete len:449 (+),score=148.66 GFYU01000458.1:59-1348(+)